METRLESEAVGEADGIPPGAPPPLCGGYGVSAPERSRRTKDNRLLYVFILRGDNRTNIAS